MWLFDWIQAILQALGLASKEARIVILGPARPPPEYPYPSFPSLPNPNNKHFSDHLFLQHSSFLTDSHVFSPSAGLDNAGKSTLLHKLCDNQLRSFVPTVKAHSRTFSLGKIKFTAWDLGGHEQVRELWEEYYSGADAVIFMVDSADRGRLGEAKRELGKILEVEEMAGVPILVLANKNDLHGSAGIGELGGLLGVEDAVDARDLEVFSCSLVSGAGYLEGFQWLSARI